MRWRCHLLLAVFLAGCAPAGVPDAVTRKPVEPPVEEKPIPPRSAPSDFAWMNPDPERLSPKVVPIEFIHPETNAEEWSRLRSFWNSERALRATQPAALLGLPPLFAGPLAAATQPGRVIKIRVPTGLDPISADQLPGFNPPTLGKWALGKLLFYRDDWLTADDDLPRLSCASCHQPVHNFTDHRREPSGWRINTPTLLNVVYGKHFFWDGRADSLEEVVQRQVEDDRLPATGRQVHAWGGVVRRLRANDDYVRRFRSVFGTQPTQDAVGKALATYLRTILSGASLHDRAELARRERKGQMLEPADYVKVMDEDSLRKVLLEPPEKGVLPKKEEVAQQLHQGFTLFHGKGLCSQCHSGGNFTNDRFHNLGIGPESHFWPGPGQDAGRFSALPAGRKDWTMVGAYKTPTLRGVLHTPGYFHDGALNDLFEVVVKHVKGSQVENRFLDPLLRDPKNPLHHRDFGLKEEEVRALTMFLKALDGEPVDAIVADPTQWPEGTEPPSAR